jgi:protein-tyrosine phosphatase
MGNICRSPAAEGVFRHYVQDKGYHDHIEIDSAGTIGYHSGSPPDSRMYETASRRGYRLESIARQVRQSDRDEFDLIVAMDQENMRDLASIFHTGGEHIRLLGSFLGKSGDSPIVQDVPDPYYGGSVGFKRVLDMIEEACPGMLSHCLDSISKV